VHALDMLLENTERQTDWARFSRCNYAWRHQWRHQHL